MTADKELKAFQELDQWLDEHRVTEVECLVPDLTGMARGKILPRVKFQEERGMNLPEAVLGMTVTGGFPEDGPYYDVINEIDLDLFLKPDVSTARVVPWAIDPTAVVIHDCFNSDGKMVNFAPRSVLRRVLNLYAEQGWTPVVAPELEFYLVARNTDPNEPLRPPIGRSGRAEAGRQAYSIDAVNEFDPLFEDIYDYCEKQKLDIDTLIHEIGTGQMEINFLHGDALELADSVFLFKRTVREAAFRHNMYATFMAKPMANQPGSAMHIHTSIVNKAGGNIFSEKNGSASKLFSYFIGGLQRYLPHAMSIFAPYVNSYRRLVKNSAAPTNVRWGADNRTVGLRVPHASPAARRVENRLVGADTNPYLAMAATLACGYLGMMEKIKPTAEMKGNAYNKEHQLPLTLRQSLGMLGDCKELHDMLSPEFVKVFLAVKESELDEFNHVISPWERAHLLLNV
jgi:glutamine synthetase